MLQEILLISRENLTRYQSVRTLLFLIEIKAFRAYARYIYLNEFFLFYPDKISPSYLNFKD
jgi:hypothetical protein